MNMTTATLASLDHRQFSVEIKARLRDDEAWMAMLEPILVERTRAALNRIIISIETQKERVMAVDPDPKWLKSADALSRMAQRRLNAMPPEAIPRATSKEARAWRQFSALLAAALAQGDPSALDTLKTPYGGLTARQWLTAREEKQSA